MRPFLAVAQTTLRHPDTSEQYPFLGLFTTVDLPRGSFLGFYSGEFRSGTYHGKNSYVFQLSDVHIRPKQTRKGVDAAKYPLAMCNEPPPGRRANVFTSEISRAKDAIPTLPVGAKIAALGFFTCEDVARGQELFVHYGNAYDRRHYANPKGVSDLLTLVGGKGFIKKGERETPVHMIRAFGLHPYIDGECYDEYE